MKDYAFEIGQQVVITGGANVRRPYRVARIEGVYAREVSIEGGQHFSRVNLHERGWAGGAWAGAERLAEVTEARGGTRLLSVAEAERANAVWEGEAVKRRLAARLAQVGFREWMELTQGQLEEIVTLLGPLE